MICKTFVKTNGRKVAHVTFTVPNGPRAGAIHLVSDFNDWSRTSHPLQRDPEGRWTIMVELELRRTYQFRYLCDDEAWMYDSQADAYVYNPRGTYNFVVVTDPDFKRYEGV